MYNLLIVDDDEVAVETIARVIDWSSVCVENVYKGYSVYDAKEVLSNYEIHVVILDIEMYGGNGFEVLEYISTNHLYCKTIFLTNHPNFSYAQKALNSGAFAYLLKPVDFDQLKTHIKNAIETFEPAPQEELLPGLPTNNKTIIDAVGYIRSNLTENISRKDVAEHLHYNEIYLSKLFKSELGITLSKYILTEKMNRAKELLISTDLSVETISEQLGYAQTSHFSKLFTDYFNMSPTKYRMNNNKTMS